LAQNR